MTLENHGIVWHIDHFIPVAKFDLSNPNEQMECFHWTNIQPLICTDNRKKSNMIPTEDEVSI
jgi:hypothetical protein